MAYVRVALFVLFVSGDRVTRALSMYRIHTRTCIPSVGSRLNGEGEKRNLIAVPYGRLALIPGARRDGDLGVQPTLNFMEEGRDTVTVRHGYRADKVPVFPSPRYMLYCLESRLETGLLHGAKGWKGAHL